eukprot:7361300-Prymnesium_polylepis.1
MLWRRSQHTSLCKRCEAYAYEDTPMFSVLLLLCTQVSLALARGGRCRAPTIAPIRTREDLGALLHDLNYTGRGAELGVRGGSFTRWLLQGWKTCDEYVQVDVWRQLDNYIDTANDNNADQKRWRQRANRVLKEAIAQGFARRGSQCAKLTSDCAKQYGEDYFDFIYVDARHDRLGVLQDLSEWWPKLRAGGLMAGHDYTTQKEPKNVKQLEHVEAEDPTNTQQDWTLNFDGTRDDTNRTVKGAVDDFFAGVAEGRFPSPEDVKLCPRQVVVTYREAAWNTWMVRK